MQCDIRIALFSTTLVAGFIGPCNANAMYTAFSLESLLDGLSQKPECIYATDTHVYIGTADGQVLLYRIGRSGAVWLATLEVKKSLPCGKKPVERIEGIPRLNYLVILAGI